MGIELDEQFSKIKKTKIIFGNIRGLAPRSFNSKVQIIEDMAGVHEAEIICLVESHLNSEIYDSEISMSNFTSHRSDRSERSHGGVIMYVSNK